MKDLTTYCINGFLTCSTATGETRLLAHTRPGWMFTVVENTPEVRNLLRETLKRMEHEAKRPPSKVDRPKQPGAVVTRQLARKAAASTILEGVAGVDVEHAKGPDGK